MSKNDYIQGFINGFDFQPQQSLNQEHKEQSSDYVRGFDIGLELSKKFLSDEAILFHHAPPPSCSLRFDVSLTVDKEFAVSCRELFVRGFRETVNGIKNQTEYPDDIYCFLGRQSGHKHPY